MALGRRAGLVLAVTGLLWVGLTWIVSTWGWPDRIRTLCDVFALAGFGFGLYLTWQAWRLRRHPKG